MLHTLIGYWAVTLSAANLLVASLSALFFLAGVLILRGWTSRRWAQRGVTLPTVPVVWWSIACLYGSNRHDYVHRDESVWPAMLAVLLTLVSGLAVLLGATTAVERLRTRRTQRP
jgi:hypothetical protein